MTTKQPTHFNPVSDYDTDTAALTDTGFLPAPPPPSRTNEELNLAVLRRHNPSIIGILSIAPYAVVYRFSATTSTWEKRGIEGTLFVVQLVSEHLGYQDPTAPEQGDISAAKFGVVVLNRRGLDNFEAELKSADDVEVTEEYVILQVTDEPSDALQDGDEKQEQEPNIIGLWIFSEPPPSSTAQARLLNAQIIQECAKQAEISREAAEEALAQARQHQAPPQPANGNGQAEIYESDSQNGPLSTEMGRQVSLRQLFGQQREDDDAWSIRGHNSPPTLRGQFAQKQTANPASSQPFLQQTHPLRPSNPVHLRSPPRPSEQQAPIPPALAAPSSSQHPQMAPMPSNGPLGTGMQGFLSRSNYGPQGPSPQLPEQQIRQPMQGFPGSSSGSQQDVLLGLFQRARDSRG